MTTGNLLVIGARIGSLGHAVLGVAEEKGWDVTSAGVSGDEDVSCDITDNAAVHKLFDNLVFDPWHSIVCTAGINVEGSIRDTEGTCKLMDSLVVNAVGPLYLLHAWQKWWLHNIDETHLALGNDNIEAPLVPLHFVAVSSNSAHIARSQSLAYCASKAALSMGIRCAARELSHTWLNVYGYEPGWLSGTPMSQEVQERLGFDAPRHRIPGDRTVDPAALAHLIVRNLENRYSSLNGCMLRLDGGEM